MVIGAGTMGKGIAKLFAFAGWQVFWTDLAREIVEKAKAQLKDRCVKEVKHGRYTLDEVEEALSRINPVESLAEAASCTLVLETVLEKLEVKQEIFRKLDSLVSTETILASNTSSLSITTIASVTKHPERVIGLHFFQPADRMPLVEVVMGAHTNFEVEQKVRQWLCDLGKRPVSVRDTPGFLVNRVACPFHLEAYRLLSEKIATKEQVDRIIESAGFALGPFRLQDWIGIDENYATTCSIYEGFSHDSRFRPPLEQKKLIESKLLGRKTGKGHYVYE
jgi:3-hydroxybutyryl-CoA dehydrogenase